MSLAIAAKELYGPLLSRSGESKGWQVVDWDLEQGPCITLRHGDRLLRVELAEHVDHRPSYASTRRFDVFARRLFQSESRALDEADRAVVNDVVDLLRAGEKRLPRFDRPRVATRAQVRETTVERALVREGAGQYYLNPYVGCMIGCPFCWVAERADLGRALQGLPRLPWGRWVDVKSNLPDVLAEEVKRLPPGPVRISPVVTDPYQPLERKYRITRRCLEVLLEAGFAPVLLTRAAQVLDDLDLLARFPRAAVGLSIPTDDDRVRERYEAGADPIEERFDALEALHDVGITTFGVVQPVLPMDADRLAERMAPLVRCVRVDYMHEIEHPLPPYDEAKAREAASAGFHRPTVQRLEAAFAARGVPVDELDDMAALLGPEPSS